MAHLLTMRNVNRAAWGVLGLLAASIVLVAAWLVGQRLLAERQAEERTDLAAVDLPQAAPGPALRTDGTLEQVQGQAFNLRDARGESVRVVIRSDAAITRVSTANGADNLRPGDPVVVRRLTEQQDNTLAVMEVLVARPREPVPAEQCAQIGTVVSVVGNRLTYESRCGTQEVPVRRSVRVTRVEPIGADGLKAGQRAVVVAERLPDGTLSASQVQVSEQQ